jgi:hypothetical protein
VHNDFKATFDVHIYSVLTEDKIEDAINYLAGRWARPNPGQPIPDISGVGISRRCFEGSWGRA